MTHQKITGMVSLPITIPVMLAPHFLLLVEAVEPFKLHITSMTYLYEVFEHLQLLRIDIWMHIHAVTTTDVSPDLGELVESLGDARVQTIPLCNG